MARFTVIRKSWGKIFNNRLRIFNEGDVVDCDSDVVEKALERGDLLPEGDTVSVEPEEKPGADPASEKSQPEEPKAKARQSADVPQRPANAASIEAWRKFAEAQGIVTKGLSKKELIAATR